MNLVFCTISVFGHFSLLKKNVHGPRPRQGVHRPGPWKWSMDPVQRGTPGPCFVLTLRDLGASCFGLRFRNYRPASYSARELILFFPLGKYLWRLLWRVKACIDEFQPNTSQANYFEGFWRITSKTNTKIEVRKQFESCVPIADSSKSAAHVAETQWIPSHLAFA